MRYVPLVFKNSLRNRRRSLLTIFSVALSLCILGVMMAVYFALYMTEASPAQALRLVTRNRVSLTLPMPAFYLQRIKQVPGVTEAMEWQWFGGVYKDARDPKNFFGRFGVDPQKLFTMFSEFQMPEEQKKAFLADRASCVVGKKLADRMGFKIGDRLTFKGDIYPIDLELTVKGIYDAAENAENVLFHWAYVREGLPERRRDMLSSIEILADSPDSVPRIANAVDETFRNSTQQTRTEAERAFQLSFLSMLGNIKAMMLIICGAVTFTILLVTANTMAMSVRERVREVGILKTLGYRNNVILGLVLGESVVISLIGGSIGYLLAAGLCAAVRESPAAWAMRNVAVQPQVGAALLGVAVLIALLSSFVPAWNASRTSILDAMRHTG